MGGPAETLTFDQVHLGVPDPQAAAQWYQRYLGAAPGDGPDRVMFGGVRFIFLKNAAPTPSHGAAIDHVGLSFADLGARMETLGPSGMRIVEPVRDTSDLYVAGVIEDPWGARIEVIEAAESPALHHVHLRAPDPAATRRWYVEMFGGEAAKFKDRLDGVKYADTWILVDGGMAAPSAGHTIDHIGFRMPDLLATAAAIKEKGVAFTTEPHPGPSSPGAPTFMSFTADPWGVKIELLQRPRAL